MTDLERALPKKAEVERRFEVDPDTIPELDITQELLIEQGYVAIGNKGSELRVRTIVDTHTDETSYTMTVKSSSGLVRGEPINEAEIPEDLFHELWEQTHNRTLQKLRRISSFGPHEVAIDAFLQRHRGLTMTEIEFAGATTEEKIAASERFVPFTWLGRELTEDPNYRNRALATDFDKFPLGGPLGEHAFKAIRLFNGEEI
ncbi:MAG: hypothetical protein ABIP50_01205 [Candidatus Saccharimonadales bacterium]